MKIEARGVRRLDCSGLDLKHDPEGAKPGETARAGFGWCQLAKIPHYVSVAMARNCREFEPADPEVVAKRDAWAASIPMMYQRK